MPPNKLGLREARATFFKRRTKKLAVTYEPTIKIRNQNSALAAHSGSNGPSTADILDRPDGHRGISI